MEDNLTALEGIHSSRYSSHIHADVLEWVSSLKAMLRNLEIMVEAQRYWVNLDPIFEGDSFTQLFGHQDLNEFQDIRAQFKRIMWSTSKTPQAIYNLKIESRMVTFQKLITYFSSL
jgi:hypothetical protein